MGCFDQKWQQDYFYEDIQLPSKREDDAHSYIDDDMNFLEKAEGDIKNFFEEINDLVSVKGYGEGGILLNELAADVNYDIYFWM